MARQDITSRGYDRVNDYEYGNVNGYPDQWLTRDLRSTGMWHPVRDPRGADSYVSYETGPYASTEKPDDGTSNPKDAMGSAKPPLSCCSMPVFFEMGTAMAEGARKYGRHNWRTTKIRFSVYFDAFMRHGCAWWEGEDLDPDSGVSHVTKMLTCLMVLRDAMLCDMVVDDRPPVMQHEWMAECQKMLTKVEGKFPDAKPPHTEKALD